jgi:DNA ligase (NAD+)
VEEAQITELLSIIEKERHTLPFQIDGAVIKFNDTDLWEKIGYSNTAPNYAIAYKFQATQVKTILNGITWQVGRLGAITPVAELAPIEVDGTVVKRASLHNVAEIGRLNLRYGDTVLLEKAGEIIPRIIEVVDSFEQTTDLAVIPKECPSCGCHLVYSESELELYCPNSGDCPEQLIGQLTHWCSKEAMNIDGVSKALITKLFNANLIVRPQDLYTLQNPAAIEAMGKLNDLGVYTISNLLEQIEKSKAQPWEKVLYALGIPLIGKRSAAKIAAKYSLYDLEKITIGKKDFDRSVILPATYISLQKYLRSRAGKSFLCVVPTKQLNIEPQKVTLLNERFKGVSVLFTGTLQHYKRAQAEKLVLERGGKIASGVSKNLDLLVVGDSPGSKKTKAEALGITVYTEQEFINYL